MMDFVGNILKKYIQSVTFTELMDTEHVPVCSVKDNETGIESTIPQRENNVKEIISEPSTKENVLTENVRKELSIFSDTEDAPVFKISEIKTCTNIDFDNLTVIKENDVIEEVSAKQEVVLDSKDAQEFGIRETEANLEEAIHPVLFHKTPQEQTEVAVLKIENLNIDTVSETQKEFIDLNVATEYRVTDTVLTKPEEILTSTNLSSSITETCEDINQDIFFESNKFSNKKTSDFSGDTKENVTLKHNMLEEVTLVCNPIDHSEVTSRHENEEIDYLTRKNVTGQDPEIRPIQSKPSFGETVDPAVMDISEESSIPTKCLLDSRVDLPETHIDPSIVFVQDQIGTVHQPDVLPGSSRETKPRQSFLRNFDPLYSHSPNTVSNSTVQDVHSEIFVANSPPLQPVNGEIKKTNILIDISGIETPEQIENNDSILTSEGLIIQDSVNELEIKALEETSPITSTTSELEKQELEDTKESIGTQTDQHKKRIRDTYSHESLKVHCNDSSQSFNEEYFEAQSVIQRHIARSLKGIVDFGPREESDIEGRVFEIEPQVYEDESELSKTPVRKRSPTRRNRRHESSGEETLEELPTQPPKYLHVLEKQRRSFQDIEIITSDSDTDIQIKKKKVSINNDLKVKEASERVKHDESSKKKKTPGKTKPIVTPHRNSVSEDQGDKLTFNKDNKSTGSEKSSHKETSESEQGKVRTTKKFVKKKGDPRVEIDTSKEIEKESEPQEEESALEDKYLKPFLKTIDIKAPKSKMADLSEKLNEQQQENSELKLQLNASQQAKASLELEIRQKEEIIIKTQAEALKNEQIYKQELKQLKEKLKENSKLIEKDTSKELEEQLKEAKARELKATAELAQKNNKNIDYQKIMDKYENTLKNMCAENQKLAEELNSVKTHLSNLELAFSDVHLKYEKTKESLQGCKANEETLLYQLNVSEQTNIQQEEKYESLMVHAKSQIERSNRENLALKESHDGEINKVKAIIKRLEIKCSSLESTLQQKTEECEALAALCDEVTGKKI